MTITQPAPAPYDWNISGQPSGNGDFNIYVTDANGRKIAAVWGKRGEKEATAALLSAAPALLATTRSGLPVLERWLALLLECHCVPDHDMTPRRETLEEDVRGEVEELEALIAQFKAAITKAAAP